MENARMKKRPGQLPVSGKSRDGSKSDIFASKHAQKNSNKGRIGTIGMEATGKRNNGLTVKTKPNNGYSKRFLRDENESESEGTDVSNYASAQKSGVESENDEYENSSSDSGEDQNDESESDNDNEYQAKIDGLREELKSVSFEEYQEIRERMGAKKFDQMFLNQSTKIEESSEEEVVHVRSTNKKLHQRELVNSASQRQQKGSLAPEKRKQLMDALREKRRHAEDDVSFIDDEEKVTIGDKKTKPLEISSKKPVSVLRNVVPMSAEGKAKKLRRDPRFDNLSGNFNGDLFSKSYSFIDTLRDKERRELEQEFKKEKNLDRKAEIQALLDKMKQEDLRVQSSQEKKKIKSQWNKAEKELVSKGKKPFFLKKNVEKKLELVQKFNQLKKDGMLDKFLEKKRRRNASKDHKAMPFARRGGD